MFVWVFALQVVAAGVVHVNAQLGTELKAAQTIGELPPGMTLADICSHDSHDHDHHDDHIPCPNCLTGVAFAVVPEDCAADTVDPIPIGLQASPDRSLHITISFEKAAPIRAPPQVS